ncbi:MAG: hypothetical protein ACM3U2_00965 [Deltaproteobacteria bacterium]
MKRMKRALLVLMIVLLAAGFVRGWIILSRPHHQPETNKVDVKLTVDPEKMEQDAERVKEKSEELGEKAREKIRDATRASDRHDEPATPAPDRE